MKKIKVLIVDDSAFMRKIITDMLNLDDEIQVVGTAKNGKEAMEKIVKLTPDVVTLDVEMPIMNGIDTLQMIMNENPIPVIMISSITKEGAEATLKALSYGAVDFITKPSSLFKMNTEDIAINVTEKIKIAAKINSANNNWAKIMQPVDRKKMKPDSKLEGNIHKIVAIGTSTGGPRALQEIIPYIAADIPASFLIVQHMPKGFTKSLAERLNSLSQINVKEAENDEIIKPGYAYIAPGNFHMKLIQSGHLTHKIKLTTEDAVSGHRPSVDMMMNSLADLGLHNLIGVILTGMGADGAEGMKKIKEQNGYTIAQDENTCIVYGMPKIAVGLNCIDAILPINEIAARIMKVVGV